MGGIYMFNLAYKNQVRELLQYKDVKVKDKDLQELQDRLVKLKGIQEDAKGYLIKTMELSASLGTIVVDINHISDELQKLIKQLDSQTESTISFSQETTAAMNEIDSALDENVKSAENILESIDSLVKNNKENLGNIEKMGEVCTKVTQKNKVVNENLQSLLEKVQRISDIITVIEEIADQTNLLALNASIEAARAGEYGRGFAVVSEEIRKLAESTKKSLAEFQAFGKEIEKISNESIESINSTNEAMGEIPMVSSMVKSLIENNFEAVERIQADMESFMASFEEISSSTTEVTNAVDILSSETEKLSRLIQIIEESINELDKIRENIYDKDGEFIKNNCRYYRMFKGYGSDITAEELINILENAKRQHKSWMETLKDMVDKEQIMPLQTDSTRCAFGHFYHCIHVDDPKIVGLWKEIDSHHNSLHGLGAEVIQLIDVENYDVARNKYEQAFEHSSHMTRLLDQIIGILSKDIEKKE